MGFVPTFCRTLISLHKRVRFTGPLLTLGNQDVWADHDQLSSYFDELDCPRADASVIPHTSRMFSQDPEAANYVHAKTFFEMLGIKEYFDIDKFEIDSPQILHDLNTPIPGELRGKFNLIIDSGTMEHIFDVRQVLENVVSMCRVSGWVIHIAPASNFMDHGFYSFSPCFFYDFYQANGFDEFTCYILQINPDNMREASPYFEYHYGMNLRELIDPQRKALTFFAARKTRDVTPLVVPTQGVYQSNLPESLESVPENSESPLPSHKSFVERVVPAALIPFLKPIRPLFGRLRQSLVRGERSNVTPPAYEQLPRI